MKSFKWPALLMLGPALTACATVSGAPGEPKTAPAGPAKSAVVLRINEESFNRSDLEKRNPRFFSEDKHARAMARSYLTRFIHYRLVVQEAVRQGLDREPEYRDRMKSFMEAKGMEMFLTQLNQGKPLVTPAEIEAAWPDYPDRNREEVAQVIQAKKTRRLFEAFMAGTDLVIPVKKLIEEGALSRADMPPQTVAATVGSRKVTLDEFRRFTALMSDQSPAQIVILWDEYLLNAAIYEAVRLQGYDKKVSAEAAKDASDKILEAIFVERVFRGLEITEAEIQAAYQDSARRFGLTGPMSEEEKQEIIEKLRQQKFSVKIQEIIAALKSKATIFIDEFIQPKL